MNALEIERQALALFWWIILTLGILMMVAIINEFWGDMLNEHRARKARRKQSVDARRPQ
jgi:hypothetical protein